MDEEGNEDTGGQKTLLQRLLTGLNLYDNVDPDLSTWTLADGQLTIALTKRESLKWNDLYDKWVKEQTCESRIQLWFLFAYDIVRMTFVPLRN